MRPTNSAMECGHDLSTNGRGCLRSRCSSSDKRTISYYLGSATVKNKPKQTPARRTRGKRHESIKTLLTHNHLSPLPTLLRCRATACSSTYKQTTLHPTLRSILRQNAAHTQLDPRPADTLIFFLLVCSFFISTPPPAFPRSLRHASLLAAALSSTPKLQRRLTA